MLKKVGHVVQPGVEPQQGADDTPRTRRPRRRPRRRGANSQPVPASLVIEIERAPAEGMDERDESPASSASLIVGLVTCGEAHATADRSLLRGRQEHAAAAATPGAAPPAADAPEGLPGRGDTERDRPVLRATVRPLQRPLTGEVRALPSSPQSHASGLRQEGDGVEADNTVREKQRRRTLGPAPGFPPPSPEHVRFPT